MYVLNDIIHYSVGESCGYCTYITSTSLNNNICDHFDFFFILSVALLLHVYAVLLIELMLLGRTKIIFHISTVAN